MVQVHRTDTGQFVLIDLATGVVVIEDELQAGYDRLESLAAEAPALAAGPGASAPARSGADSVFSFQGRRNLTLMLTVGLPFVWFLFIYLALHQLDRPAGEVEAELETLRAEIATLRAELSDASAGKAKRDKAGGVKSDKDKAKAKAKAKPVERKPASAPAPSGEVAPADE